MTRKHRKILSIFLAAVLCLPDPFEFLALMPDQDAFQRFMFLPQKFFMATRTEMER